MTQKAVRVLTIAGSDSGGGAGIQADLKTFTVLECHGTCAVTALTAQNTRGVHSIHPVPADFVRAQIRAVLTDIGCDAVKTGMLHDKDIIETVASELAPLGNLKFVLDPVMTAKNGALLLKPEAVQSLKKRLIPLAMVITPNIPEAQELLGFDVKSSSDIENAARELLELGCRAVLVKGGHAAGACDDCLAVRNADGSAAVEWFKQARIDSANTHGTGCTLSAAIASYLARGAALHDAVSRAKQFVTSALEFGRYIQIGGGNGPVDALPISRGQQDFVI